MMKSNNICNRLCLWHGIAIVFAFFVSNSESLSPYHPQCSQSVCQNLPSNLDTPHCHQDECGSNENDLLEKRTSFCESGCHNFRKAMQGGHLNGCSKICNLTQLESSLSWNDNLKRPPILACVYGCERAIKNFVTHILSEIQTIRPPQILRKKGNQKTNNDTSETVTFDKKTETDISGRLFH